MRESQSKATPAIDSQPMKESERLNEQIHLVEIQQLALTDELRAIDKRLDQLAGQEEVDEQAVAEALNRKQAVFSETDFLTRRTSALEKKRGEAERAEAQGRLDEIPNEASRLVEAESLTLIRFHEIACSLLNQAKALVDIHVGHRELILEEVFLLEKFNLARPDVPQLSEVPKAGELSGEIAKIFSLISEASVNSLWVRKRQRLAIERRQEHQPRASAPERERVIAIEARPNVRVPAKPEHEEDRKPNIMQRLLSA